MMYRILKKTEIKKLKDIERKEYIENTYYILDGALKVKENAFTINWTHEKYEEIINSLIDLFDNGGTIFGALEKEKLVGIASLDSNFIGKNKNQLQLNLLHVDSNYRGQGIGKNLLNLIKNKAIAAGAENLYISSISSKKTVDFYLSQGCTLTNDINEELFRLEPKDIHLELKFNRQ